MTTRGILSAAGYVPYRRLNRGGHRQDVRQRRRQGHPSGRRPTTKTPPPWPSRPAGCVRSDHAGRRPPRCGSRPRHPAYLDKNNASAIHAALRLDSDDPGARLRRRAAFGCRCAAHRARRCNAPVLRRHLRHARRPARRAATKSQGGDGAAAILIGGDADGPVIAEYLGAGERDRRVHRALAHARLAPVARVGGALRRGEVRAARRAGVERGAEGRRALTRSGQPAHRHRHARPRRARRRRAGSARRRRRLVDDLASTVGNTGTAHAALAARRRAGERRSRARSSRWSCSPTAPTCSCSARPTRSRRTGRRARSPTQIANGAPAHLRQVPRPGGAT